MGNPRSASNAWAKIRSKLMTPSDGSAPPATPKKTGGRKKAVKEEDDAEDGEAATPKKTPRKRAAKKQNADGDASPKKKGRAKKEETEGKYASQLLLIDWIAKCMLQPLKSRLSLMRPMIQRPRTQLWTPIMRKRTPRMKSRFDYLLQ